MSDAARDWYGPCYDSGRAGSETAHYAESTGLGYVVEHHKFSNGETRVYVEHRTVVPGVDA